MDDFYDLNGFKIIKGCVSGDAIAGAKQEVLGFLNSAVKKKFGCVPISETIFQALSLIHERDLEFYKAILGALWRFVPIVRLLRSSPIELAVKELVGSPHLFLPGGDVVHIMSSQLLIPGGYHGLGAHQDWPSVRGSDDGLVAWLPLTDVTHDTYPIEVIPGSHKHGIFSSSGCKERPWEISIAPFVEADFKPLECSAGDLVLFSNYLVHRSAQSGASGAFRLAISTRFDNGLDENYLNRGLPTAYKRVVDRLDI